MQEIDYSFDNVNNIERITNHAGVLSNGLGGTYRHDYSYDNLYRLTRSTGNWVNNNTNLSYGLDMTYEEDGRIKTKYQNGTTLINGVQSGFSYRNVYTYNANQQQHTIRNVYDNQNNLNQDFQWDANGNMTLNRTQRPENLRRLCWDEENRLMAVGDNKYTSYYVYDNGGERTYKLTGPNTLMNINGNWMNFAYMDNPTLYTSAYLVASIQGYTKHYYAGSERIASAIGLGGLSTINQPITLMTYEHKWEFKSKALNEVMTRTIEQCLNHRFISKKTLANLNNLNVATSGTMLRYFYHPDHLGSSSWITDGSGNAIQHLHYLPFGEDWVDQRNSSWNAPYTFSGKEKDVETGYGYFGARYYDSELSVWLSVDPMSDKYPNQTNYVYCSNNPVMIIDPNGADEYEFDQSGKLLNVISNEKEDIIRVYKSTIKGELIRDDAGNPIEKDSKKFEHGTIYNVKEPTYNGKQCTEINFKKSFEHKRQDVFEFLAENSNVEWGTIRAEGPGNYFLGCVGTSRDRPSLSNQPEGCTSYIVNKIYGGYISILNWDHSHPLGTIGTPSGYDPSGFPLGTLDNAAAVAFLDIQKMRVYDVKEKQYYLFNAATFLKTTK